MASDVEADQRLEDQSYPTWVSRIMASLRDTHKQPGCQVMLLQVPPWGLSRASINSSGLGSERPLATGEQG